MVRSESRNNDIVLLHHTATSVDVLVPERLSWRFGGPKMVVVTAQLHQILSYLDRDGVTELVIATSRSIAMRQNGNYVNLTARPLTFAMLTALVDGTPISPLIPKSDASTEPTDVDVGSRRLRIRTGRRGDEVVVRVEAAPKLSRTTTGSRPRISRTTSTSRAKRASQAAPTTTGRQSQTTPSKAVVPAAPPPREEVALPSAPLDLSSANTFTLDLPSVAMPDLEVEHASPPTFESVQAPPLSASQLSAAPLSAVHAVPTPKPAPSQPATPFARLVAAARAAGASDLHISAGRVVSIRHNAELAPLSPGAAALTASEVESLLMPLLAPEHDARLQAVGYVDLAVDDPGGGRLRANISRHQVGLKGTFRLALAAPKTLDELGLPKDVAKVVSHHQGFVVIAGPSGHGKTTTLAALVDLVNSTKPAHILLVEDPIEIVHPRKVAVISQREAGRHTKSFASALKASLREDPDVIVIGELRDRETVEIALTASETGHLVIATMSTPSAAKTLDRLIDMFPPEDHSQVRASIAGALRAIVAQRLLPAVEGGVVPAVELLTGVLPLAALIRDDKLYQLPNLMQRGRSFGMIRFDDSLAELARAGKITEDTALAVAQDRKDLASRLKKGT